MKWLTNFSGALALMLLIFSGNHCADRPSRSATLDASDYRSIQAALDALPVTGGVVNVPAGISIITSGSFSITNFEGARDVSRVLI